MKKLILLLSLMLSLFGCKVKDAATTTTVDRRAQTALKGSWILTDVNYPGENVLKVNAFQIADTKCFEGSRWDFIPNNDSGKMELTQANCLQFNSDIKWYVNKEQQFVLKMLNAGDKARKVREGYILMLRNQSLESFQLVDKVDIAGKMTEIVYQFKKNK
ncbi:lipocalin family protein [Flavobacterium amniphilum]|uniref:lipocalin family protein n=1 Tax=Flavobacterium amniphilum TaxID=1834035 RepID=UPI00202AA748|nr:lipocalin family protein [Flavobacterium amniphilum]MCL9806224.1 lipocalin family protein [Flavobacterium amniphilum]